MAEMAEFCGCDGVMARIDMIFSRWMTPNLAAAGVS
jgi:hypothetical protein